MNGLWLIFLIGCQEPTLIKNEDQIRFAFHPKFLQKTEIQRQIHSGLTTTFVIEWKTNVDEGLARLTIRYEPWDEVFFIACDSKLGPHKDEFKNIKVLEHQLTSGFWPISPLNGDAKKMSITLSLIPYSQHEQLDTQSWFRKRPGPNAEAVGIPNLTGTFLASSIKRKSLLRFHWRLMIPQ